MKFENGFALEDGFVDVYVTDSNGIYLQKTTEYVSKGTGLSAGAYLDAPPKSKDGFAIVRKGKKWTHVEDHRGKTVYSTENGQAVEIKELGELPSNVTSELRPTEYHTWWRGQWHLSQDAQAQQLSDSKEAKLLAAASKADTFIAQAAGTKTVPDFEQKTWALQAVEAKAWHKDNSAETPLLDNIANNRGVDRVTLIQKALQKALMYEALTSSIAGQRQKLEDAITTADSLDTLNNIEISYQFEAGNE